VSIEQVVNPRAADVWQVRLRSTAAMHFGPEHVLADVAARLCAAHRASMARSAVCGACWELAIRNDERFAVEFDLPRDLTPDPDFVDEIAVELACRGERVSLTPVERAAVVRRLVGRGVCRSKVAALLNLSHDAVTAIVGPARPVAAAA
jgi:hypothetical protein